MDDRRSYPRRLRVVTLVDSLALSGGGEKLAREIATRLDPNRFERTLCVSRWSEERRSDPAVSRLLADLDEAGVSFLGLRRRGPLNLAAWRPLIALLRRERVDVLHAHKFGSNVWAAVIAPLAGVPVLVVHEHTWSFEGQPVRKFLDRNLIARKADAFIAVSREDLRRMIEVERIDPAKLIFVPNGIPTPPPPSGNDVRAELGIEPGVPVIGTVCALRAQKALDVLVDAAAMVIRDLPELRVLIAGRGPERAAVQGRIERLGLAHHVLMLGHRSDVPDVLAALDVAVSSSAFEGTPLAILEYMDAGLPVVATRVGGIPDLIEPGENGLLVDPGDPAGLAAAIRELLADPSRAAEMGRRGRERRRREFEISVTVKHVEQLYVRLAAEKIGS